MKAKIRVAFFADMLLPNLDGANRTMFEIIRRIPKDTFEFIFITGQSDHAMNHYEVIKMPALTIPMNDTYKIALPLWATYKVNNRLKTFKPDIIHIATPSLLGKFALNYADKNSIPVSTIYHTHYVSYVEYYLKKYPNIIDQAKKWVTNSNRSFYNRCDLVLVPCEAIKKELNHHDFDEKRMKIWSRGINFTLFDRKKYNSGFLKKITRNNNPNILFASRLVWEKNLDTLIKIYNKCADKKYNFIIAGTGIASDKLQNKMPNAFFLGHLSQSDLAHCYASADVFLFPSISESYGNVVAEALASGLPCVIGNGGGSVDFIQNGINGFICDPMNPLAYKKKLDLILSDEQLEIDMSANARTSVGNLSWDDLITNYFEYLTGLLQPQLALTA